MMQYTHFLWLPQTKVAPVGLSASCQPHFRFTALETSTPVNRRRSLTSPQTPGVGPPDLRPFCPAPGNCSAAAPHTALQPGQAGQEGYTAGINRHFPTSFVTESTSSDKNRLQIDMFLGLGILGLYQDVQGISHQVADGTGAFQPFGIQP